MQLRYNYRVYPTPGQQEELGRAFGCARVVFNDALRVRQDAHAAGVKLTDTEVQRRVVTQAKQSDRRAWLAEVSSVVLVQACQDARAAFRNFFDSLTGRRKGRRVGFPRFRSRKDSRQSVRLTRNGFSLRGNGRLYVAKVGELDVRWSRALPSGPSSVTVIRDAAGRYFASFVVQTVDEPLDAVESEVGIDLGLATFAVLSDGKAIVSPKFLRQAERRLRRAQQGLSRKEKGSKNRARARVKVARAHARVRDARLDWAHRHTTGVDPREPSGLRRGPVRYRLGTHTAGQGRPRRRLGAVPAPPSGKAARYGRTFHKVGCFLPSSQLCCVCGARDGKKPLSVREWTCTACGAVHDRDFNAAKNILAAGRAERLNACGEPVSLSA